MRKLYALLFITFTILPVKALPQSAVNKQELQGVVKYYGTDAKQLSPKKWVAHWIWRRGDSDTGNVMLTARKAFSLANKPAQSRLYITADSHYSLWVNGSFVCRGPARCAPHHQSVDVMDISNLLKAGENVLAIKVHHSGNTVTYMNKVKPGLLFQLDIDGVTPIVSDAGTKVRNEIGWDTATPQIDGSNMARVENFDFRRSAVGWEQPDFDDSGWEKASLVTQYWWPPRKEGSTDQARMMPWHDLVPRDIPYLTEDFRPVTKLFETGECAEASIAGRGDAVEHLPILGVMQHQVLPLKDCKTEGMDAFLKQQAPLRLQNFAPKTLYDNKPFKSTWMVFDMGQMVMGYPVIELDAPKGTTIDITYAPFLLEGKYNPAIIPDNQGDRIILPGGKIRWEAQEFHTFRYIGFMVSGTSKPITITQAGLIQTAYPFPQVPLSNYSNDVADKLMQASAKTLHIVTNDAYNDNYRERRQYIQTAWYDARCNYALYGDTYLMRRCLIQIAQDQLPNGFLPMHAPGKPKAGILEADMFWHMGLFDYFMYSGDRNTVAALIDPLKQDLAALQGLENADGVLEDPPHPYWIDHTDLDRRGINFTLNGWYAMALHNDAQLLLYMGENKLADECAQRSVKIKAYLAKNFWNEEKGLFVQTVVNGKQSGLYDEISNGIALQAAIANNSQAKTITQKILHNDDTHEMVRPVIMMYWPVEGLFSAGYGKQALQLLAYRYNTMLNDPNGNGTLWEGWSLYTYDQNGRVFPKTRSATQAEQTFYPDVFMRHLLGVEITAPGMKSINISYHDNGLPNVSGILPTPYGNIFINWSLSGKSGKFTVKYPRAIKLNINKRSFPGKVEINRQPY